MYFHFLQRPLISGCLLPFIFGGEFRCVLFKGLGKKGHIVEAALYGGLADPAFRPVSGLLSFRSDSRL